MTDCFAQSSVPFLDMAANQAELARKITENLKPSFASLGLSIESFVVENISLPDDLQKLLDERIGMTMIGEMGRYAQFQAARSIPIAAANEGSGAAGVGVGLGAGITMAQTMMNAVQAGIAAVAPMAETKFCLNCGKPIPKKAKFCPDCGGPQQ
jgi:membrane protease subunit (stomatin/prohibitin family)